MDTPRTAFRNMLADDPVVNLDDGKLELLSEALADIALLGDVAFKLEVCANLPDGHSLSWDNAGAHEQDSAVDLIMERVARRLWPTPMVL